MMKFVEYFTIISQHSLLLLLSTDIQANLQKNLIQIHNSYYMQNLVKEKTIHSS